MPTQYTGYGNAPPSDLISNDYQGSYQEWMFRVVASMSARYSAGDQSLLDGLGGATGSIGQPDRMDFGNGTESLQTRQFFENYIRTYGGSDPYIINQFGPPPSRNATYEPNPDSASSINGTFEARSKFEADENAKDRASDERIAAGNNAAAIQSATISANAQIESTRMRVGADIQIATLEDATRRYIAEGDWGTQKYIAELQEKGAMDRLVLELGDREKDRAQRALFEANRHGEAMTSLAIQVAAYDAELAAQPRNWLKYAAWLKNRDVVVNGLTLAMAADMVPDDQIDPAEVATTAGGVAALQASSEQMQAQGMVTGESGGAQSAQSAFGPGTQQIVGANQTTMNQHQPAPSAQQLGQTTDYGALARQLLGMNPLESSADQATPENLQAISNTLTTSQHGGKVAAFGNYTGPTTNALGVTVAEPTGQKVDYRQFSNLLDSQQQMKIGEIESLGRYTPDFVKEMEKSRPKGYATGAASFG